MPLPPLPCPCRPCPAPYRDALWVQVVTVGAIVEVDLIEGLRSGANDPAAVVEPVAILGDDDLAQGHGAQELALGGMVLHVVLALSVCMRLSGKN